MKAVGSESTVLITGAAGNLGGILARHLADTGLRLRLMYHKKPLPEDVVAFPNVSAVQADLGQPTSLGPAMDGVDTVVHLAGVLFAANPERFLPSTNTWWFQNLLQAVQVAGTRRVILISFPHVEGPTTIERPATGRLDGTPISVHAETRLAEERALFEQSDAGQIEGVCLRVGMVYGDGVLMIDAARWLAEHRMLGVWREPTWIQLISKVDFVRGVAAAISRESVSGIYHVGDEHPVTLQEFLDTACEVWGCPRPHRMPLWLINTAADLCEVFSLVTSKPAPLTRDFVRIGQVSYWGDTSRTREELLPELVHPNLASGLDTLRRTI